MTVHPSIGRVCARHLDCRADLADMGAGVSTDDMLVAGVPVGVDAWVKTFVEKKARSVITDVVKLDVVSDGLLHN